MNSHSRLVTTGLVAAVLAVASAPAFARHRAHRPHARANAIRSDDASETAPLGGREGRGPFLGAGGIFSPDYEAPGRDVYHLGGQLLGGEFGKAYEDYYRHYYYYKYAYCPIGSSYVIYLRRCVSPFDLVR